MAAVVALGVTAVVNGAIQLFFADWLASRNADRADRLAEREADRAFRYERRKEIRAVLGEYDGRLIEAASDLHARFRNLWTADPDWLEASRPNSEGYFYRSTVYRFLSLYRLIAALERRAIFFDRELTPASERCFLLYAKALELAATDSRLFGDAVYDANIPSDHFFRDQLRTLSSVDVPEGEPLTFEFFVENIVGAAKYDALFEFFAGFGEASTPLRWDRIIVIELLLMAFLDTAGFAEFHKSGAQDFENTLNQLATPSVRTSVQWWIPALELPADEGMTKLNSALSRLAEAPVPER